MKKIIPIVFSSLLFVLGCSETENSKQSENSNEPIEDKTSLNETEANKEFNFLVAGHIIENDETTYALLGPTDQKWIINKSDVLSQEDWEEKYDNVSGTPKILTVKFGSVITTEDGSLTVGEEIKDINNRNVQKAAACKCEVSCNGGSCCAINGFRTYCSGASCIQTTERC